MRSPMITNGRSGPITTVLDFDSTIVSVERDLHSRGHGDSTILTAGVLPDLWIRIGVSSREVAIALAVAGL